MTSQKTALIIGVRPGNIGSGTALALARVGFQVMISARTKENLDSVASEHANIFAVPGDILVEGAAEALVRKALSKFGRLDLVMYAAGDYKIRPFEEVKLSEFQLMLKVHAEGAFAVAKEAVPILKQQDFGSIVFLSSFAGIPEYMLAERTAYNSAQAAKLALGRTLEMERVLNGNHYRSVTICAGSVLTPMTEDYFMNHPEEREKALTHTEAGTLIAESVVNDSYPGSVCLLYRNEEGKPCIVEHPLPDPSAVTMA